MPTTFTVFSLGQLPVWDTTEGNATLATGNVKAALGTYGSAINPLYDSRATFSPAGTGFAGGDATAYNLDNNASNDQFSINGGPAQTFDASMIFNATITYIDGTTVNITAVVFQDSVGNTYWAPEFSANADQAAIDAKAIRSLTLTSPVYADGVSTGYNLTADRAESTPLCLCAGTMIRCPEGERLIEDLQVGDLVETLDNGAQPIRWIGKRTLSVQEIAAQEKLAPVMIAAGALGAGLPRRDLAVSRQHRICVGSRIAERMFGAQEVLIPAIKLTDMPGIYKEKGVQPVTYYHLLFDAHQVIFAEGAATESLFTGAQALLSVSEEARDEILALFPQIAATDYVPTPARELPAGKQLKKLLWRHAKNDVPLTAVH